VLLMSRRKIALASGGRADLMAVSVAPSMQAKIREAAASAREVEDQGYQKVGVTLLGRMVIFC
jgi:hypothetical protein